MPRNFFLIGVFAAIASGSASAQDADAQTLGAPRPVYGRGEVYANGRCNGLSYGTGARRCNTRSGGPVGGISGRN